MPTIGASIHIIQKFLFECECTIDGNVKKFQKPFFFTWLGSLGLFMIFIIHLLSNFKQFVNKFFKSGVYVHSFLQIAISTFFNLMAGALANISNLYLNYSVSLMLRSSTLIFGALISEFYLKKYLMPFQKQGVIFTIIAIFLVGLAAFLSDSKTTHRQTTPNIVFMHVFIRIISKSLQAISMLIEEKVMQAGLTPFELTGLSGIWSIFFSTFFLLPFESFEETMQMLVKNKIILTLSILSVIIYGIWNCLALFVTNNISAVTRMMFDQFTIILVWLCQVIVFYSLKGTNLESAYGRAGEEWSKWSFLQLFGFLIMIYGACVYREIVKPICEHNDMDEVPLISQDFK